MKEKICAFCGHSIVTDDIEYRLYSVLSDLITKENYNAFYSGGMGEFDKICEKAVRKLKKEYHNIKLYRVIYKYKTNLEVVKEMVDGIIIPELNDVHYKELIIKRNEWMVDSSDNIVCYIRREHGGAYRMMRYAEKHNKNVVYI